MAKFPTQEWLDAFQDKLNNDAHYAQVARNWEGDMRFVVEPGGPLETPIWAYMDLWHGKCRAAYFEDPNGASNKPAFVLQSPYGNMVKILRGELDPMQAMLTRKLSVQGNLAIMMRSVPTVLDFVRCGREITDSVL